MSTSVQTVFKPYLIKRYLSGYSPAVSHLLHAHHIDSSKLKSIQGSGRNGFLLKADVLLYLGLLKELPILDSLFKKPIAQDFVAEFERTEHDLNISKWSIILADHSLHVLLAKAIATAVAEMPELSLSNVYSCAMTSAGYVVQHVDPQASIAGILKAFKQTESNPFKFQSLSEFKSSTSLLLFDPNRCGSMRHFHPPMTSTCIVVGKPKVLPSESLIRKYERDLYNFPASLSRGDPADKEVQMILPIEFRYPAQMSGKLGEFWKKLAIAIDLVAKGKSV